PPPHHHTPVRAPPTPAATQCAEPTPPPRPAPTTSNGPDTGLGDGDQPQATRGAPSGTDDRQFLLRNERSGTGHGRIYTITYSATDASGNTTLGQPPVSLPRG